MQGKTTLLQRATAKRMSQLFVALNVACATIDTEKFYLSEQNHGCRRGRLALGKGAAPTAALRVG